MENPYQGPKSAVDDPGQEYQPVRVFAVSGRIGRLRYIAYSVGLSFLIAMVAGIIGAVLATFSPTLSTVVMAIFWPLILVISVMLTIQRAHDFDTTGWLAILMFVPLVNLIFWFIPGSDGPNRFGARTPPNSKLTVVAACILPFIFVVGIIAAVALPAYQDYAKRAAAQKAR